MDEFCTFCTVKYRVNSLFLSILLLQTALFLGIIMLTFVLTNQKVQCCPNGAANQIAGFGSCLGMFSRAWLL